MTQIEALNQVSHRGVRIAAVTNGGWHAAKQMVQVVPSELASLVHDYPVFLTKSLLTGRFELSALLGIEPDENLYIDDNGSWIAGYIPLDVRRVPFGISKTKSVVGSSQPVVTIDLASPRIASGDGDAIFGEDGGNAQCLEEVLAILGQLQVGAEQGRQLVDLLLAHDLIEPVQIALRLSDGRAIRLEALYSVHDQRLQDLADQAVLELHRCGALKLAHLLVASIANVRRLIDRKNVLISSRGPPEA